MKRITFFLLVFFAFSLSGFGQDILIKSNGDEIRAKVLEVGIDIIKYKMFDNPDGPLYSISKKDVFMIKYENGSKETFKIETPTPVPQQNQPQPQNNNTNKYTPIYRTGNYFYANGIRLSYEDVENYISESKNSDVLGEFQNGKKVYNAGLIVEYVGTPLAITGLALAIVYGATKNLTYGIAGLSTLGASLVLIGAGSGVASSGRNKMGVAVDKYNSLVKTSEYQPYFKLHFGGNHNTLGVGITYNF